MINNKQCKEDVLSWFKAAKLKGECPIRFTPSMTIALNNLITECKIMRYPGRYGLYIFEKEYYKTYELKPLAELEEEVGLAGKLSKIKKKVELHYGVQKKKKTEVEPEADLFQRGKSYEKNKEKSRLKLVK